MYVVMLRPSSSPAGGVLWARPGGQNLKGRQSLQEPDCKNKISVTQFNQLSSKGTVKPALPRSGSYLLFLKIHVHLRSAEINMDGPQTNYCFNRQQPVGAACVGRLWAWRPAAMAG
jgi:hypothetical protein